MSVVPRKYEVVDAHTVRLIVEKQSDIDLATLLKNRAIVQQSLEKFQSDVKVTTKRLSDIDEIIAEAKKLGITPREEKNVPTQKPQD